MPERLTSRQRRMLLAEQEDAKDAPRPDMLAQFAQLYGLTQQMQTDPEKLRQLRAQTSVGELEAQNAPALLQSRLTTDATKQQLDTSRAGNYGMFDPDTVGQLILNGVLPKEAALDFMPEAYRQKQQGVLASQAAAKTAAQADAARDAGGSPSMDSLDAPVIRQGGLFGGEGTVGEKYSSNITDPLATAFGPAISSSGPLTMLRDLLFGKPAPPKITPRMRKYLEENPQYR